MNSYVRRTLLWLVLLINSGFCQVLVGFVGRSVLLPCVAPAPERGDVLWRDGNNRPVLTIKNNVPTIAPKFIGRLSHSPDPNNRNFSITIKNLQLDDADTYECNILAIQFSSEVKLQVKDEPEVDTRMTPSPGSNADVVRTHILGLVLISLVGLLL